MIFLSRRWGPVATRSEGVKEFPILSARVAGTFSAGIDIQIRSEGPGQSFSESRGCVMDSWFLEAEETAVRAAGGDEIEKKSAREFSQGWAGSEEVCETRVLFEAVGLCVNLLWQ